MGATHGQWQGPVKWNNYSYFIGIFRFREEFRELRILIHMTEKNAPACILALFKAINESNPEFYAQKWLRDQNIY